MSEHAHAVAAPAAPTVVAPGTVAAQRVVERPGMPLDGGARSLFEPAFGADFSDVRVHTDRQAEEAATALGAAAFTVGNHVAFGTGAYRPGTEAGREVLHHELTHVLQQRAGGASSGTGPLDLGEADGAAERAAVRGEVIPVRSRVVQRTPTTRRPARYITDVYVDQAATPQTVRWKWSDTGMDTTSATCSTGKGHCCCEDAGTPACSEADTRVVDSNYTPVGDFRVARLRSDTWPWWTEFVSHRGIALHQYPRVDGTPLSHGCVRMKDADARRIYENVRVGSTTVHVTGLPTPLCARASVQAEWALDYTTAETETSDGETRAMLRRALGIDDTALTTEITSAGSPTTAAGIVSRIPRCLPGPGPEEQQIAGAPTTAVPTTPGLKQFALRLNATGSPAQAQALVRQFARNLWQQARARAQRKTNPDLDDRPLYWARLRTASAIRAWQPQVANAPDIRRRTIPLLLEILERSSRGLDEYAFPAQRPGRPGATEQGAAASATKRIVVSGFDPFGGTMGSIAQANPSASAVLALDGMPVEARPPGGAAVVRGRIEGVVFPVRYRDFDMGIVENAIRPHLTGPQAAHLVMTISRGGSLFELEEQAGRRRSSRAADNAGVVGNTMAAGSSPTADAGPPIPGGPATEPEFRPTSVSSPTLAGLRSGIPRTGAIRQETDVVEMNPTTGATTTTSTPSATGLAVEGAGGGFLSNEIFYRVLRLEGVERSTVPAIHLHVPALAGVDPVAERRAIVDTVKRIIVGALPTL